MQFNGRCGLCSFAAYMQAGRDVCALQFHKVWHPIMPLHILPRPRFCTRHHLVASWTSGSWSTLGRVHWRWLPSAHQK